MAPLAEQPDAISIEVEVASSHRAPAPATRRRMHLRRLERAFA
jgi:hypothetical protein